MNPIVVVLNPFGIATEARAFADDVSAQDYANVPKSGRQLFRTESQLSELGSLQLVALYNALTGEKLKKFSDKQAGVSRIVKATFMSDNTPTTAAHAEVDPNQSEQEREIGAANEPDPADLSEAAYEATNAPEGTENKVDVPAVETGEPVGGVDTPTNADVTAEEAVQKAEADLAFDDGGETIQGIRERAGEVSAQNPDGPVSDEPGLPGETVAEAAAASKPKRKGGPGRKPKQAVEGEETAPKAAKAPKAPKPPKAPKAPKPPAEPKLRDRGINLQPRTPIHAARAGSKQALLIDALFKGTTLRELTEMLARTGKPWTTASIKTGFNWDVNRERGYGVRTVFTSDPDAMREVDPIEADVMASEEKPLARAIYHLVLPEGMTEPMPHTTPKPKGKKAKGDVGAENQQEMLSEAQETSEDAEHRSL